MDALRESAVDGVFWCTLHAVGVMTSRSSVTASMTCLTEARTVKLTGVC